MDLIEGRRRGDDHRFLGRMGVHPPSRESRGQEALAYTVGALYCNALAVQESFGYFSLLGPQVDVGTFLGPGNGVIA